MNLRRRQNSQLVWGCGFDYPTLTEAFLEGTADLFTNTLLLEPVSAEEPILFLFDAASRCFYTQLYEVRIII